MEKLLLMDWTFVGFPLILQIKNSWKNPAKCKMQAITICSYASILAKSRCLHIWDLLCISQAASCARTRSIHSTLNLQVACGMESLCASPFFLFYLGDEFLLCKCSACKPYFNKTKK